MEVLLAVWFTTSFLHARWAVCEHREHDHGHERDGAKDMRPSSLKVIGCFLPGTRIADEVYKNARKAFFDEKVPGCGLNRVVTRPFDRDFLAFDKYVGHAVGNAMIETMKLRIDVILAFIATGLGLYTL